MTNNTRASYAQDQIDVATNFLVWVGNAPQSVYSCPSDGTKDWQAKNVTKADIGPVVGRLADLHRNVYYSPGQISRTFDGPAKPGKKDISGLRMIWVDIDPSPELPSLMDIEALVMGDCEDGTELAGVIHGVVEGVPRPHAVVYSGRGMQVYWRLETPAMPASFAAAESAMRFLAERLHGDRACAEISHVLRLPGSINWGDASKPKGNFEAQTHVVYFDLPACKLADFGAASDHSSKYVVGNDAAYSVDEVTEAYTPISDLSAWCDRWHITAEFSEGKARYCILAGDVTSRVETGPVPEAYDYGPVHGKQTRTDEQIYTDACGKVTRVDFSSSGALFGVVNACLRKEVPETEILALLMNPDTGFASHIQSENDPLYKARRQIARITAKFKAEQAAKTVKAEKAPSLEYLANAIVRNQKGFAIWTTSNVQLALESFGISVAYNEMTRNIRINGLEKDGYSSVLEDCTVDHIEIMLTEKLRFGAASALKVQKFIGEIARDRRFHPVREYLTSLKWDGVPRLDSWLIDHAGVIDTPFIRAVSSLVLMAAVRRVRKPGEKFDELLILQSDQGAFKSEALQYLVPDRSMFSDQLKMADASREVIEATDGRWIIEIAELQDFTKKDHGTCKAFLSRQVDRARAAYGRIASDVPRQWIAIATSNEAKFLSDPTGNRRYWPVTLTKAFSKERIVAERDQLWAEAAHREAQPGASIRLDPSLWGAAEKHREEFEAESPLYNRLAPLLAGKRGRIDPDTLWNLCEAQMHLRTSSGQMKKAMQKLGWIQHEYKFHGAKVRGYTTGHNADLIAQKDAHGNWIWTSEEIAKECM